MSITTKSYATQLWENLSGGLQDLYEKYKLLTADSDRAYELRISALKPQYETLKNNASVKAQIEKANTQKKLTERGIAISGESMQHELSAGAALQNNLAQLDRERQREESSLSSEKQGAAAKIAAQQADKTSQYIYDMNKAYYNQLNADESRALEAERLRLQEIRDAFDRDMQQKEWELKQQQQAFEQEIERAYLAIKQKSAATAARASGSSGSASSSKNTTTAATNTRFGIGALGAGASSGVVPSANAQMMVNNIINQYTSPVYGGGSYIDVAKVKTAIRNFLKNAALSESYRFEISLYASSLGYL